MNDKKRIYSGLNMYENQIPFMLISGRGAGFHVEQLIKKFEIFNLIIYDENLTFVKLSMHLIDWEPILVYFSQKCRTISFTYNSNPETLAQLILYTVKNINPMLATNIYFFNHLMNDFMKRVIEEVLKDGFLLVLGLGFYDDEIISLENTIININNNYPIFSLDNNNKMCDIPLFIVGSGPSIDNDIEFIKKNQDKAIICSAGTGISVLYSNGIKPDFHFEGERAPTKLNGIETGLVEKNLSLYNKDGYFDDIIFAGLNVLHTRVFELFKNKFLFFRASDCGSSVVSDKFTKVKITNPSVLNAIVSLSVILKFKSIYLFGADSGFRDNTKHHSKDSLYYTEHFNEIRPQKFKTIEGNFGGQISADVVLSWIRENIEAVLRIKNPETTVYNCSDGAKIKYTKPLRSSEIKLTKTYTKKQKQEPFLSKVKTYNKNDIFIHETIENTILNVIRDIEVLEQICNKYVKSITVRELYVIIQVIFDYIKQKPQATKSLLGGTIKTLSIYTYMHTMASMDNEKNNEFVKKYLQILLDFLKHAKEDLINRFLQDK